MGLTSFSGYIEFAIKQEKAGLDFIENALKTANESDIETLKKFGDEAQKSLKALQTILRENVTEMVMEPCEELDETAYLPAVEGLPPISGILAITEKQRDFLVDVARVTNLNEVRRALLKIADRKTSLINALAKNSR